jgi:hypothetical protein
VRAPSDPALTFRATEPMLTAASRSPPARARRMQLLVQQLAPISSPHGFGIETLETASYVLQAYRAETGVQFFVTADPRSENLAEFLVRRPLRSGPGRWRAWGGAAHKLTVIFRSPSGRRRSMCCTQTM